MEVHLNWLLELLRKHHKELTGYFIQFVGLQQLRQQLKLLLLITGQKVTAKDLDLSEEKEHIME